MGTVILSLDAELKWGFHDLPRTPVERTERARDHWLALVDLLDAFSVPATWAIVGHLFLDTCDGRHRDHPAPPGWFDPDPGTDLQSDPDWYGPDLVSAIIEADVEHDIGCHGFSHVEIGQPDVPDDLVSAELSASQTAAASMGIDVKSFVFPRNVIGNREALATAGFTCYRTRYPRPLDSTPIRLPRKGFEFALGRPAPLVTPSIDEHGLVAIPPSIDLFGFEGPIRRMSRPLRDTPVLDRVERGLAAAIADDGLVHLWCHPHDLARPGGKERFRRVLTAIEAARADGLTVETMDSVAQRTRQQESTD